MPKKTSPGILERIVLMDAEARRVAASASDAFERASDVTSTLASFFTTASEHCDRIARGSPQRIEVTRIKRES